MKTKLIAINNHSPTHLQERVFRLRYKIYEREMDCLPKGNTEELRDEIDNYSTNYLLTKGTEDIGTLRLTSAKAGPLEIASQCQRWKQYVDNQLEIETSKVVELTRLMIIRQHRGGEMIAKLFRGVLDLSISNNVGVVLLAAKVGAFARFYSTFGAVIADPEPIQYTIGNNGIGDECVLMRIDLRREKAKLLNRLSTMIGRTRPPVEMVSVAA